MEGSGIDLQKGLPGLPEGLVEPQEVVGMWAYVAAGAVLAVMGGVVVWLVIRGFKRGLRIWSRPGLPPKREAEEALRRLESGMDRLDVAEFAVRLSATVRRCVDRLWHTELGKQTIVEHWMENGRGLAVLPGAVGERLGQFLEDCDALKFQPVDLSSGEKEAFCRRAGDLIAWLPAPAGPARGAPAAKGAG